MTIGLDDGLVDGATVINRFIDIHHELMQAGMTNKMATAAIYATLCEPYQLDHHGHVDQLAKLAALCLAELADLEKL